ncbi:dual specificity protein phosphatase 14 isoform X2 [Hyperolius riggenbachi]|uniref:dual specificity protein phosphatase 14 isoform X2 n=1 Tax=Hyperolius riggenbachi TaxID=752182 RepID=UPI0035A3AE79
MRAAALRLVGSGQSERAAGDERSGVGCAASEERERRPAGRLRKVSDRQYGRRDAGSSDTFELFGFPSIEELVYMPLQLPAMNFRSHRLLRRSPPPPSTISSKPTPVGGTSTSGLSSLSSIAQISPCLYLSSGNAAGSRQVIYARNVTCIVNATLEIPNSNWPDVDYIKVPVPDLPNAPLALYFDSVADRIHQNGKRNGRTLVHCVAGVSRSATLCIAYLMKYHRLSLLDAHQWVKTRRPVVRPNAGFWQQLIQYEKKLFGKNTVRLVPSPLGLIPDIYERETRNLIPVWGFR